MAHSTEQSGMVIWEAGRPQRTIARTARVDGFGLFGGVDVSLEFCPAPPEHGVVFERVDLSTPVQIPAGIDYVQPRPRCTVIEHQGTSVAVIEHVMAALAGLRIDNCLVRINAPEPPGGDGSSAAFVAALLQAGEVEQDAFRLRARIQQTFVVTESDFVGVGAQPPLDTEYEIGCVIDYGSGPIGRQLHRAQITPDRFISELSACRTFVHEQEVQALQAQGIGLRATPENVLVFSESGVIDNSLRFSNECVRHKILDCVGDFALLGCDLVGRFTATQSGHRLNHELIRQIAQQRPNLDFQHSSSSSPSPSVVTFPVPSFIPERSLPRHRAAG